MMFQNKTGAVKFFGKPNSAVLQEWGKKERAEKPH